MATSEFYVASAPSIPAPFSDLLSSYSKISKSDQEAHVQSLRDRAYGEHPYPCLGRWRFLELDLSTHPAYPEVLAILKSSPAFSTSPPNPSDRDAENKSTETEIPIPIFLDLGCCLAQDTRKLIHDLSPTSPPSAALIESIYAADLRPSFIDVGYALFRDESILPRTHFLTPADVFDTSPGNTLSKLDGRVNVLQTGAFFHLFSLDEQKSVARRALKLLRREGAEGRGWAKKALILGQQVGNVKAGDIEREQGKPRFRHDEASWRALWEEIAGEEEWKEVVKRVQVESRLETSVGVSRERKGLVPGGQGRNAKGELNDAVMARREQGFRWHLWWVWVEFDASG